MSDPHLPTLDRGSRPQQTATVVRSYGHIITRVHDYINPNTRLSLIPLNTAIYLTNDEIAMRLRVLSNNILLDGHSFRRFRACVPNGHRTKVGLTKLIMDDFGRQANKPNIIADQGSLRTRVPSASSPKTSTTPSRVNLSTMN